MGLKPKRTIRVVFWVNEENGGRGGGAYLKWVGDAVKNHVAAIEMDEGAERPVGFGYGPFNGQFRLSPNAAPRAEHKPTAEQDDSMETCRQIAQLLGAIQATAVNQGGGERHRLIVAQGVPSLSPTTTGEHYFDRHHTQADTVDKVDPSEFKKNTALLAVLGVCFSGYAGAFGGLDSCRD